MEPGTDERIKCLLAPIDAHVVPRRDNAGADLKDPVVDQAHGQAAELRFRNQRRGVVLVPWHKVMEAR